MWPGERGFQLILLRTKTIHAGDLGRFVRACSRVQSVEIVAGDSMEANT